MGGAASMAERRPGVPRLRHGVGVGVGHVYTEGTVHCNHRFPKPWFPKREREFR
jgi:hypothetical protein